MKISKIVKVGALALILPLIAVGPVSAQEKDKKAAEGKQPGATPAAEAIKLPDSVAFSGAGLAAGLGMGLTIIGAGFGSGQDRSGGNGGNGPSTRSGAPASRRP